jgi:hypothetical protein
MTAMGGFAVRRTWAGGELHRMTQEQAQSLLASPFMKASTPTSHQPQPVVTTPSSDAPLPTFSVNKKGQMGFDF